MAETVITKIRNGFSSMDVEFWNASSQFLLVFTAGATFVLGGIALYTERVINRRQTSRIVALETDLANANKALSEQQERTAIAQRELLELQLKLQPRTIPSSVRDAIVAELKTAGSFSAQIHRYSDVTEVAMIGHQIAETLSAAGWKVGDSTASGGILVTGIVIAISKEAPEVAKSSAQRLVEHCFPERVYPHARNHQRKGHDEHASRHNPKPSAVECRAHRCAPSVLVTTFRIRSIVAISSESPAPPCDMAISAMSSIHSFNRWISSSFCWREERRAVS